MISYSQLLLNEDCTLPVCSISYTENYHISQVIHTETKVCKIGPSKVIKTIQLPLLEMDKYLHFHAV